MHRTWKPIVAGILTIVAGILSSAGIKAGVIQVWVYAVAFIKNLQGITVEPALIGIVAVTIAVVTIVGGIFALRRKRWGLALTGTILAIICAPVLGIPAVVFVSLARGEFLDA